MIGQLTRTQCRTIKIHDCVEASVWLLCCVNQTYCVVLVYWASRVNQTYCVVLVCWASRVNQTYCVVLVYWAS